MLVLLSVAKIVLKINTESHKYHCNSIMNDLHTSDVCETIAYWIRTNFLRT